jgi:hypothetical protein
MSDRWIIYVVLGQASPAVVMNQEHKFMLYRVLVMAAFCVLTGIALSM